MASGGGSWFVAAYRLARALGVMDHNSPLSPCDRGDRMGRRPIDPRRLSSGPAQGLTGRSSSCGAALQRHRVGGIRGAHRNRCLECRRGSPRLVEPLRDHPRRKVGDRRAFWVRRLSPCSSAVTTRARSLWCHEWSDGARCSVFRRAPRRLRRSHGGADPTCWSLAPRARHDSRSREQRVMSGVQASGHSTNDPAASAGGPANGRRAAGCEPTTSDQTPARRRPSISRRGLAREGLT